MFYLPESFQVLIQAFSSGFTRPSFRRFTWLTVAAILTLGSHTVNPRTFCLATRTYFYIQDGELRGCTAKQRKLLLYGLAPAL